MTDIALPPRTRPVQPPAGRIVRALALVAATMLLFAILASINWSAVLAKTERACDLRPGPFSSGFGRGFVTYSCECSSPFHFAEACPTPATVLPSSFAPAL